MKKQTNWLSLQQNKEAVVLSFGKRLSLLFPGCLLLAGFWAMVVQELVLGSIWLLGVIPGMVCLAVGLFLRWDRKWQAFMAIGALVLCLLGGILLRRQLESDFAGFLSKLGQWWFLRTGNYTPGYASSADGAIILVLLSVLSGFLTAWLLRMRRPFIPILLCVAVVSLCGFGLLSVGWWLAVYLLGSLLTLAVCASGRGKALTFSGAIALVLAAVIVGTTLLAGYVPAQTQQGTQLGKKLHSLRWETAENPMPEGDLRNLGVFAPTHEPALEVTMDQWSPLYIRGFVAGDYSNAGWKPVDAAQATAGADILYTLQKDYFYGADQTAAAWQSVQVSSDNTVSIRVLGACRSTAYLPYGAGAVTEGVLSAQNLRWEGLDTPSVTEYSAQLYPVASSYLLQEQLKDTDTPYRLAESDYRDWVYTQYLTVPEEAYRVLTKHFSVDGDITTVQATREIAQLLPELINYNENTLTSIGQRDFISYVLEVSKAGYSVHYATLATLLLRCCGIPARYVEGYVVSPGQAEALSAGDTLVLTQSNAHAWTEYYLDGVGWIPFDATPGYAGTLVYELPADGLPTQESGGIRHEEQPEEDDPQKKPPKVEEEKTKQSQQVFIREAINVLLLIVAAVVALVILRVVLLRNRLRKKQQSFYGEDHKRASAEILCYLQTLVGATKAMPSNMTVSAVAAHISDTLDETVPAAEIETLFNEVWYSNHPITAQQQEAALSWLQAAQLCWKKKVSPIKRFQQRFISCKII